jgi:hypothetical protein
MIGTRERASKPKTNRTGLGTRADASRGFMTWHGVTIRPGGGEQREFGRMRLVAPGLPHSVAAQYAIGWAAAPLTILVWQITVGQKDSDRVISAPPRCLEDWRVESTFTDCPEFHAMQPTRRLGIHTAVPVVRWGARILSVPILLLWAWFLTAHLFGDGGHASRPLVPSDYGIMMAVVVSLVGLVVAWKWELLGGALTLAAVSACALLNWRVLVFPGTLIPVAAVMFMAFGWMSGAPPGEPASRPQ